HLRRRRHYGRLPTRAANAFFCAPTRRDEHESQFKRRKARINRAFLGYAEPSAIDGFQYVPNLKFNLARTTPNSNSSLPCCGANTGIGERPTGVKEPTGPLN